MIDTHSHLFAEEFKDDLNECIDRAKANNINKIVLVGFSKETNEQAYLLSQSYSIFYPTAGVHPDEADANPDKKLNELYEFVNTHKVYAIGECGLDYYWTVEFKEQQKYLFKAQCDLAVKLDLPIIIHMREATLDTYNILKEYQGKIRGVMHCYSGSVEMAKEFIKLGFYISLGGPVTFKNAKEPKEVAKIIPIDKILVETDCPYLAPVPYRGKRNESAYVKNTLEAIAELRNISYLELEKITDENTIRLFHLEER